MGGEPKRISIEEARRLVLAQVTRLEGEAVDLADALGRVLAEDAVAPNDLPPFDSSGMDGFAVIAVDTDDAPVALKVIGESRAGTLAQAPVTHGTAIRVSTGAVIPEGADAVVRQELTEIEDGAVIVNEDVGVGNDVRYAGEDIRRGETILHAGTLLGSAEIGALAAVNIARPVVVRRPRIALVSTGDELVSPGPELEPGQIRDANAPALTAAGPSADPGRALFVRMGCGSCHRLAAGAGIGQVAPDLDLLLPNYDDAALRAKIVDPYPAGAPEEFLAMPQDFGRRMNAREVDELVDFLLGTVRR
jgi:molybdopterin biosynthesis enzyme